ncbi:K78R [African swine fever virus]|uniref:K78R n=1 Tax=African swine fever virus TaxID=10497 RepID=A0A385KMK4_ASF|nr:K78R [African swine fever virus]AXZ96013.1 K78R [African swine fever virus]AXZ96108.1 K78R [African swine fever virus]
MVKIFLSKFFYQIIKNIFYFFFFIIYIECLQKLAQKVPQIKKQRRAPPNLVLPEATPAKPMLLRPCIPGCSIKIW